jgi:hypothetical protein
MLDSDDNYDLRRKVASNMSDNDILSLILELSSIIESLKYDGHDKIGFLEHVSNLLDVDKEEVIDIALKETKNAMIPFLDEMEYRRKN